MSRFEEVGGRGQLNQNRHLVGQWCATKKTDKHRQTHTPTPSLPPSLPPPSFSFTHTSLWLSHWNGLLKAGALVTLAIVPFPPRNSLLVQMLARLVIHLQERHRINLILILIAFITGNSSLEPLTEGLCAQIHVNLR